MNDVIDLSKIKSENADFLRSEQLIDHFFISSLDPKELGENFRVIMDKAREFGNAEEVETLYKDIYRQRKASGKWGLTLPELWEAPRPLENSDQDHVLLPENCLPSFLWDFLQAVSSYVQVFPEMCIFPLLSALSACVQDKAVIEYPWNSHTETLNIYSLTIAPPSERKSSALKPFIQPIENYISEYNAKHQDDFVLYEAEKQMLEYKRQSLIRTKNNKDPEKLKEVTLELAHLEPVCPLQMLVSDATPEALASEMHKHNEKMAILTSEGGIFNVISGLYSNGASNIDIFLHAYSGEPYRVIRRTGTNIDLKRPLLTMGIMTQPEIFSKAIKNEQFRNCGFNARFMFSFPKEKAGERKAQSPDIPYKLKIEYNRLIRRLLELPTDNAIPIIEINDDAQSIFLDYYDSCESQVRSRQPFEVLHLKEWMQKQFGRCLKIAGILHLCEYNPADLLNGDTAYKARQIARWAEQQTLKALGTFNQDKQLAEARYVLDKIIKHGKAEISKREILRKCRTLNADDIKPILDILEDYGYIETIETLKKNGRPSERFNINPYILE